MVLVLVSECPVLPLSGGGSRNTQGGLSDTSGSWVPRPEGWSQLGRSTDSSPRGFPMSSVSQGSQVSQ